MYEPHYLAEASALIFVDGPMKDKDYFGASLNAFVCGALQDPDRMAALLGRRAAFAPAVALGYRRSTETISGHRMPFMIPADEEAVLTGVVWLDLNEEDLGRIEELELDGGHRRRITVDVRVGERTVEALTYVKR